jgi:phosphoribosylformimino-5-aminoimidazole carboxamide ribotide isomerase
VKLIPAIDLRDNKCVRLKKGKESQLTIFNENPVKQAKFFEESGCSRIHIVDLDGAFGRENINKETILKIRNSVKIQIELGGGIKNEEDISYWSNQGINFLIVGSLAIKNKNFINSISKTNLEKIYIALDVLNYKIMIKGWTENSKLDIVDVIDFYNLAPVKGFILTDISRDGMLEGLDLKLINKLLKLTQKNVIVGGGLSNYEDLRNLKKIKENNLEGVITGKSYYSGNISIDKALEVLNSNA